VEGLRETTHTRYVCLSGLRFEPGTSCVPSRMYTRPRCGVHRGWAAARWAAQSCNKRQMSKLFVSPVVGGGDGWVPTCNLLTLMAKLVFVSRVTGQNSLMKPAKQDREIKYGGRGSSERHCTLLLLLPSSSSSSSPLCRVFILTFLRQTMALGNTVLQLFCCYYSWCLYR